MIDPDTFTEVSGFCDPNEGAELVGSIGASMDVDMNMGGSIFIANEIASMGFPEERSCGDGDY